MLADSKLFAVYELSGPAGELLQPKTIHEAAERGSTSIITRMVVRAGTGARTAWVLVAT